MEMHLHKICFSEIEFRSKFVVMHSVSDAYRKESELSAY